MTAGKLPSLTARLTESHPKAAQSPRLGGICIKFGRSATTSCNMTSYMRVRTSGLGARRAHTLIPTSVIRLLSSIVNGEVRQASYTNYVDLSSDRTSLRAPRGTVYKYRGRNKDALLQNYKTRLYSNRLSGSGHNGWREKIRLPIYSNRLSGSEHNGWREDRRRNREKGNYSYSSSLYANLSMWIKKMTFESLVSRLTSHIQCQLYAWNVNQAIKGRLIRLLMPFCAPAKRWN